MKSKEKNIIKIFLVILSLIAIIVMLIYIQKAEKVTYAYEDIENITINQENELTRESINQNETAIQIFTQAEVTDEITNKNLKISNAEKINLDEIIEKNTQSSGYREEIYVHQEELEYITKYRNNDNIYIGITEIAQEGRNGVQAITTKKVFDRNGKLIKEEQVSAVVVKSSINKVIDIGTKVKPKPKPKVQEGITSGSLDFNMALNKPSGFTLEQFTKALTDTKDKNKIFEKNAKYFYYIEKQYNINGMFVAAVGIHESAWGTSKIALNKNNLFGYGAYDSNPYNGAYTFDDYAEAIDLVSRVFVKFYLNPKGTIIYDGQTANGKYYSGNTLSSVNKRYATDKNWANGVYTHMQYLYSKIK
ncbi:MAG: G5 domain-containing protein [Clostridia bacterium]|nr:G5 domain-containing protein [Clostridia bacterium]